MAGSHGERINGSFFRFFLDDYYGRPRFGDLFVRTIDDRGWTSLKDAQPV